MNGADVIDMICRQGWLIDVDEWVRSKPGQLANKARGEEIRFRVRETAEWKMHAADLEMEMIKRGMIFEVINWSQGQAELPL
jgi:hypothetical protein